MRLLRFLFWTTLTPLESKITSGACAPSFSGQTGLLAIAMLRHDEALEFLLSLLADGKISDANDAIAALRLYRQDHRLWQRVCQLIEKRANASLLKAIE